MKRQSWKSALFFIWVLLQMESVFSQDENFGLTFNPPIKTLQDQEWDLVISVVSPTRFWTPEYWEIAVGNSAKYQCDSKDVQVYRISRKWIEIDTINFFGCLEKRRPLKDCKNHLVPHEDTTYSEDSLQIESSARVRKYLTLVKEIMKENYRGPSIDGADVEVKMAKRELGGGIVTTKEGHVDSPHSFHPASKLINEISKLYWLGNRCRVSG